ncbi:MAG: hypothetical protein GXO07_01950 [Crenarchaeota archaeon]|nr:hypothetical protein [Thermoproteota archaeon]
MLCPKGMLNGPCGGVRKGGLCEVDDFQCPFVKALKGLKSDRYLRPLLDKHFKVPCEPVEVEPSEYLKKLESFAVSAEVEPWSLGELERALSWSFDALNVTDNPLGLPHLDSAWAASWLASKGKEVIAQLTCRAKTREALTSSLLALEASGVRNVLALTGDWAPSSSFDLDAVRLVCLVQALRRGLDWAGREVGKVTLAVGVAANPYFELEEKRLLRKARAGAQFAQTQPVFDEATLRRLKGYPLPTVPSVLLTTSRKVVKALIERGVNAEEFYESLVRAKKEGRADEFVLERAKAVAEEAYSLELPGIHLMAPGRPDLLERFRELLSV